MHVHVSRVRRNGKLYEYVQLVESYRREDGMPTQRVVAKLGSLPPQSVENLKLALQANKQGQRVVVRQPRSDARSPKRPVQTLRYLDAAVLRQLWCELGLAGLVEELMPRGEADVAPADIVAALAIQRCLDPGSKLYAERWFPRTALPELLGVEPASFNNTRLHRVLDELESVSNRLMLRLPERYEQHRRGSRAMFLDVSDTWFVGRGPDIAESGKTKEGIFTRKVGIVLLCTEQGLPLRWEVVSGRHAENDAMHAVVESVAGLKWVQDVPLVMDRAMGASAELSKLLGQGVHFVSALKTDEFAAYTDRIPSSSLADVAIEDAKDAAAQAAKRVAAKGMQRISSTMYALDLGVVERDALIRDDDDATDNNRVASGPDAASALATARRLQQMVNSGQAATKASAARRTGISRHVVKWYWPLLQLAPDLQTQLLDGRAPGLSITQVSKVARMPDYGEQRKAFEHLLATAPPRPGYRRSSRTVDKAERPLRVRAVVNFNPERFVTQRIGANETLDQLQAYVAALNAKLAKPKSRRTAQAVERELDQMLRRRSLLDTFTITVAERPVGDGLQRLQATLTLNAERWERRRNYDGFSIIVAHPDVDLSAADLSKLYRSKDAVEKDFQVIKSFVQLRPVRHRTDAKVRAHVTLCMVALLLERVLTLRLQSKTSSREALELLATCTLSRFHDSLYVLTELDDDQRKLLKLLRLERLGNDGEVAACLRPRNDNLPRQSSRKLRQS